MTARDERVAADGPGTNCDAPGQGTPMADSFSRIPTITGQSRVLEEPRADEFPTGLVISTMRHRDPRDTLPNPYPILHELGRFSGTLEALHFLYCEEAATKYSMRQRLIARQIALDAALHNLVRHNLVTCDTSRTFPYAQTYRLTERGKALANAPLHTWLTVLLG
jgi:hypothetical protein